MAGSGKIRSREMNGKGNNNLNAGRLDDGGIVNRSPLPELEQTDRYADGGILENRRPAAKPSETDADQDDETPIVEHVPQKTEHKDPGEFIKTLAWLFVCVAVFAGLGIVWWLLYILTDVRVWAPFMVGFIINLGLVWSLLLARDGLRKRRLEIVAFLIGFLIDRTSENGKKAILPASIRLALERYMFDFGDAGAPWSRMMPTELSPEEEVSRIYEQMETSLKRQQLPSVRLKLFLTWLPMYLPFVVLAGFFFVQFFPTSVDYKCLTLWLSNPQSGLAACKSMPVAASVGNEWASARFWNGHSMTADRGGLSNTIFVATFAFAGAFIACWRGFVQGVVSSDLNPVTFLRAVGHCLIAIIVAIVAYNTLSPLQISYKTAAPETVSHSESLQEKLSGQATLVSASESAAQSSSSASRSAPNTATNTSDNPPKPASDLHLFWLLTAFVIGFYPDLGLALLLRSVKLGNTKRAYDGISKDFESVPIEILDGIEYDVRSRLAEFKITDIQHLATANPVILFAETPSFGLYQTVDWVAQAQLCNAVGVEAFVRLRQWRIRTIFDLERIADGNVDVPDYAAAVVEALLSTSPQAPSIQRALTKDNKIDAKTATAIVKVMLDDLHVMRLRQLWKIIESRLGSGVDNLYRAKTT